jgi:hypothetical protein
MTKKDKKICRYKLYYRDEWGEYIPHITRKEFYEWLAATHPECMKPIDKEDNNN